MGLLNRMDRMVSFRLSQEEYEQFKQVCLESHARSVSDMARSAVHHWLQHGVPPSDGTLQNRVMELEDRVEALTDDLQRLSKTAGSS